LNTTRVLIVFVILSVLLGVAAGVQTARLGSAIRDKQAAQLESTETIKRLSAANKQIEMLKSARTVLADKYDKLHAHCVKLDSVDTRNQADLTNYIKAEYPRIPGVLAKLIGERAVTLSKEHQMPFELAVGIMEVESGFNPTLVSSAHARGIMQVRWNDWKEHLKSKGLESHFDLHEVDYGIIAGITAFLDCLSRSENVEEALWRYNGTNGKKGTYANKVYTAMGEFSVFRSMLRHAEDRKDKTHVEQAEAEAPVLQGKSEDRQQGGGH
jgi:soluble lytic murein transglycosylase-like protein